MNKNDFKLIGLILIIVVAILFSFYLFQEKENKKAVVYYENKKVLTIDLSKLENKSYEVDGYNGKVIIKANNGKVKVEGENSPLHLCSKQGYISKSYETIICLPNKITVKIESNDELDTIVK